MPLTKPNKELINLITKLLGTDVLPNGKLTSNSNIANYCLGLKKFTFNRQSDGKIVLYKYQGIYSHIKRVSASKVRSIAEFRPEPLKLSEDIEGFNLPDGEDDYVAPLVLEDEDYSALVINDIHLYFHSTEAVRIALAEGRNVGVNKIIINGDLMDLGGVGRFTRRPDRRIIKDEIEIGKEFFNQLRKLFPSEEIIYKTGNHDARLEKYIYEKAPELYGIGSLTLYELLDLKKHNVKMAASSQMIKVGKLNILHGHEFLGGAGTINVARQMRLKTGTNIMFGHFHKTQSDFSNTIDGGVHGSWSVGCLCQLRPAYFTFNQWNHGFALVKHFKGGDFSVDNKKIVNGRVV
jgi:predicted phosphodiesterase